MMKRHSKKFIVRILLATVALTTLASCGQKGPLRLPPEKSALSVLHLPSTQLFVQRAA